MSPTARNLVDTMIARAAPESTFLFTSSSKQEAEKEIAEVFLEAARIEGNEKIVELSDEEARVAAIALSIETDDLAITETTAKRAAAQLRLIRSTALDGNSMQERAKHFRGELTQGDLMAQRIERMAEKGCMASLFAPRGGEKIPKCDTSHIARVERSAQEMVHPGQSASGMIFDSEAASTLAWYTYRVPYKGGLSFTDSARAFERLNLANQKLNNLLPIEWNFDSPRKK